ncbi:beta-glucosidase [Planoprotostelium fungivorum]|uniref:beta-glucosidase n=1 Tax=Planoprotostelium fungivorum TaxID=1890364 RepID=A0A2P6NYT9_9EUKA|nr:beta-glucosidase [Planoprotostelium fungivorum]
MQTFYLSLLLMVSSSASSSSMDVVIIVAAPPHAFHNDTALTNHLDSAITLRLYCLYHRKTDVLTEKFRRAQLSADPVNTHTWSSLLRKLRTVRAISRGCNSEVVRAGHTQMRGTFFVTLQLLAIASCAPVYSFVGDPTNTAALSAAQLKAKNFVAQLTLSEKVNISTGVGWAFGLCVGNTPNVSRLNFTGLCLQDSPTGVRFADHASAFPAGLNAAQTWDVNLAYERALAMGDEFRKKGVHVALSPMMNMGRVAAGGRNWEGFGADPFLTSMMAVESVRGIQDNGVVATAKHYIANEQENMRTVSSSNIDDRTLHEFYALPFLYSVRAGVQAIMCSYNLVNNTYACENDHTINTVLKGQFGFKGYVMSDWAATHSTLPSIRGGLDMTMPGDKTFDSGDSYFGDTLIGLAGNDSTLLPRIEDMAERIMTPYFLFGQDTNFPPVTINSFHPELAPYNPVGGDHADIIRRVGAESHVLLKNTAGALPLTSNPSDFTHLYDFALYGLDAGGPLHGPNYDGCGDHGCVDGTVAQGWGSGTSNFPHLVSPLEAIQTRVKNNNQTLTWNVQCDWSPQKAINSARISGVALVFVHANSGEEYINVDGNVGDRNNLTLWNNGDELIRSVASVNPNTIVIIHAPGPVIMTEWIDHPNVTAVLFAGLPGQETGNALVDVLFGDVNPSAKLVFTVAKQRSDYGMDVQYAYPLKENEYAQINYNEGTLVDYRWFDAFNVTPQFPFGFGLSYTTFRYSNLRVRFLNFERQLTAGKINALPTVNLNTNDTSTPILNVTFTLENIGNYSGKEVAQLYISLPDGCGAPVKILKGFTKVFVLAKSSVTVTIPLYNLDFASWDTAAQAWLQYQGNYTIRVGTHSRDPNFLSSSLQFGSSPVPNLSRYVPTTSSTFTTSATQSTATASATDTRSAPPTASIYGSGAESIVAGLLVFVMALMMM